jgi:photosystem II stability/assembly factor-like uncharacterized protein
MMCFNLSARSQNYDWQLLTNSPVPDSASQRFEDIYFADLNTGYIAQYTGKIYKTINGGNSWTLNITSPDFPNANYRSLGFFTPQSGLLGTLRFNQPLFRTTNGGTNWIQVGLPEPRPYGICGISIVNANVAYAVGRYAAPANVIKTTNQGANWTSLPMDTSLVRSLVDCYFWSADSGIVVGGYSRTSYQVGNAVVLITTNGGASWQRVYKSDRTGEWCWKISFISRSNGFISIERHSGLSYFLKTIDGGFSWQEKVFREYDQEGIGFINDNTGWIGGWTGPTYKTTNGGNNWFQVPWGYFVNRFRFLNNFTSGYAVGDRVYKFLPDNGPNPLSKFAIIGDYGKAGSNIQGVSSYIHSWNPDFVITAGNNNYETGSALTIDDNVGQYFSRYIHPYTGNYGTGDTVNRFFPALGEVDWLSSNASPYLNYFSLPGNERYYDFAKGNVHFFAIDSDPNEPDGIDSNSLQAQWLKSRLAQSGGEWNVVYFNHPPYTSGTTAGPSPIMRWPFKQWGAHAVISGREHNYERLLIDGIPYFVNGAGGKSIYPFGNPVAGSIVRYNSNYGFMMGYEFPEYLEFRFFTKTGIPIDSYRIYSTPKTLSLTFQIEGYVDTPPSPTTGEIAVVYLRRTTAPYDAVDTAKSMISSNGTTNFTFSRATNNTDYYIVVQHKNTIETWSSAGVRFTNGVAQYNFTDSASKAYGNNIIFKSGKYCIYSGDVNQDGIIDATDFGLVDNSAFYFTGGQVTEDLNGDFFVDAYDLSIVDNNSFNFVSVIRP